MTPTEADGERTRAAIAVMLRAHHAEDLPTRASIEAHPGGAEALRWVAEHHALQGVRARGLLALSFFPDDASLAVVRAVLADPGASPSLRAASTRALSGWDLSERSDLRALAVESLYSDNLSVAVAGAVVLRGVPEARAALHARDTVSTPSALRRQLR